MGARTPPAAALNGIDTGSRVPYATETMSVRSTSLVVIETVALGAAIAVAADHFHAGRLGAARARRACCSRSRSPPTCSRSATAASGSAAASSRSCSPWRCSAPRRPPRSASRPCSSTTCAPATRVPLLLANLTAFATFPLVGALLVQAADVDLESATLPAARVRRLHGHEPPELPDDRRPPRVRHPRVAARRVPQDLRAGAAERDPQRRAVRARRRASTCAPASRRSR